MDDQKLIQIQEQDSEFANRCPQTKCTFFVSGGCQPCSKCGKGAYHIDMECSTCISCVHEAGKLRFDAPSAEDVLRDIGRMIDELKKNKDENNTGGL